MINLLIRQLLVYKMNGLQIQNWIIDKSIMIMWLSVSS